MTVRFYIDPVTDQPHIYAHSVDEEEVEDVLARPMEDRAGRDGSRIALGQIGAARLMPDVDMTAAGPRTS